MDDYKWTDLHFPLSALNAGMMAVGAIGNDPEVMAYNGTLLAFNGGLAVSGRKDEIREEASEMSGKALGGVYDAALKDGVVGRIGDVEADPGSRTSGR